MQRIKKITVHLFLIVIIGLFIAGLAGYSGKKVVYLAFTFAAMAMLANGFMQKISFGYLFLSVFLWLGFWLKLTLHIVFTYPFVEPVGGFIGMPEDWDSVVTVATIGCLGVIFGSPYFIFRGRSSGFQHQSHVPMWYVKLRLWLWSALLLMIVSVALFNAIMGIHQIGLVPRSIFFWPVNALISWMLNIGFATAVALFLWWDILLKRNVSNSIHFVIVEALMSGVSIMSRGIYIFHTVPQLWAVYQFRKRLVGWASLKTIVSVFVFTVSLVISISAVSTLRNVHYQSETYWSTGYQEAYSKLEIINGAIGALEEKLKTAKGEERYNFLKQLAELNAENLRYSTLMTHEKTLMNTAIGSANSQTNVLLNEFGYQISDGFTKRILQLAVDRWIGFEGVMAVDSYPKKSTAFFLGALLSSESKSNIDAYQAVSQSIYMKTSDQKFKFRTLPGLVAFLYYSGSLWIVFFGMILFSLVLIFLEFIVKLLTHNPIICSLYGAEFANNIVQFGGVPAQNLTYCMMLGCGLLLVYAAISCPKALRHLRFINNKFGHNL